MLAGGAFAAAGDLSLAAVLACGWLGAIAGDQTGYRLGRAFGPAIERAAARRAGTGASYRRARELVAEHGSYGVFFSTWALAPLGPYVNFAAGAGGLGALRFTVWDAAGEAIWVGFYVLMGYAFATEITELAGLLSDASGLVFALCGVVFFGVVLVRRMRRKHHG